MYQTIHMTQVIFLDAECFVDKIITKKMYMSNLKWRDVYFISLYIRLITRKCIKYSISTSNELLQFYIYSNSDKESITFFCVLHHLKIGEDNQ